MKKIVHFGLIILFALVTSPSLWPIFAQSPTPAAASGSWKHPNEQAVGDAIYGGDDVNLESSWSIGNTVGMLDIADKIGGTLCTASTGNINECIGGSTVGTLGKVIAMTFTEKPADVGMWIADVGHTLGFMPKAYAQGVGFSGLAPLLPIWKAFRNIAYLLMALVMIALGFMIMFRKKIDPKTVVTAQNAIPRVVIALILITFSYAIVGLAIDAMYVVLYFAIALFKSTGYLPKPNPATLTGFFNPDLTAEGLYAQGGLWDNFGAIEWDPYKLLFGWNTQGWSVPLDAGLSLAAVAVAIFAIPATFFAAPVVGTIGTIALAAMPLIHLLLSIAMLYLFIRLMFFFISAYIQIIISLLMAPLQLLAEAFPGSNAFSSWFKNLVANLAVFPIGGAMFMLSAVFTQFTRDPSALPQQSIWAPPYTSIGFVNNTTSIASIIALGILFAIPQVAGSVKESLKAKPAMPMMDFGQAGGTAMNLLSTAYYFKMLAPSGLWDKLTGGKGGGGEKHA